MRYYLGMERLGENQGRGRDEGGLCKRNDDKRTLAKVWGIWDPFFSPL
jgi:hypothetical protein